MPSATIATTVATGIRRPRMQGIPPICFGSTVTLVNFICCRSEITLSRRCQHHGFQQPPLLVSLWVQRDERLAESKEIGPPLLLGSEQIAEPVRPAAGLPAAWRCARGLGRRLRDDRTCRRRTRAPPSSPRLCF